MRSRIGITDSVNSNRLAWTILSTYFRLKGYRPLLITADNPADIKLIDGLIILGGVDINPERYGEAAFAESLYQDERDQLEIEAVKSSIKKGIPILGVCRGMQLVNVALGGSLYQDVSDIFDDFLPTHSTLGKIFARRRIYVEENTHLATILGGCGSYKVNSLHHQGVNQLGDGLKVSAREKNGLIQAIESTSGNTFLMGVQWHPEYMLHSRHSRALLNAFLKRVQAFARSREIEEPHF